MLERAQKEWLVSKAFLYIQNRRFSEAVTLLEALGQLAPGELVVQRAMAVAYLHHRQHQKALRYAEQLLEADLSDSERACAYLIQSMALWRLGHKARARQAMQQHLALKKSTQAHNL